MVLHRWLRLKRLVTVGDRKLNSHMRQGKGLITELTQPARTFQFAASGLTLDILFMT